MQKSQLQRALNSLQKFLNTPLEDLLQPPAPAIASALTLFQSVAAQVPAYRDFLARHSIEPKEINNLEQFQTLPFMTKDNYLRSYPLNQLCYEGNLSNCDMLALSSGSTGKPSIFPRFLSDELQVAVRFEQIFHDSFAADQKPTLAVVCFALGNWVGGMFTTACCRHLATKGYPITVATPGNNKEEIFRIIRELDGYFEQVVLLGYPPFLKDVIDSGRVVGIEWQKHQIKFVLAGEVFSEEWRSLVGERSGVVNPYYDFASLYGTADAGVLGNETPLSIAIRRFLSEQPEAARALFGESRLPTLVQYNPRDRYFETQDGTLLFSGDNGIPLVRYHIADEGGLISYTEMLEFLNQWNFNPQEILGERGIRPLPFAYIFGRSHFTVSYFGANIYPENVTVGLEQPTVQDWVTGKFVIQVKTDADQNAYLQVAVELAPGVAASPDKSDAIASAIHTQLLRLNSEFANYVPPVKQIPQILLLPQGDPQYFPLGVKHRYTRAD